MSMKSSTNTTNASTNTRTSINPCSKCTPWVADAQPKPTHELPGSSGQTRGQPKTTR
ncbi:hypothetical protein PGT21_017206 [Puccinia graminis f. sp. tritici]|uniref:Uncharacterized protein n=1 Tax=Puccinia graminis f. sp. tritici TaxID=56615 RepID=A0A5B0M3Q5_PUCGR|nr:hypothetical protein PGT21_017206 [Puccinia graminis f. sp. tritici]